MSRKVTPTYTLLNQFVLASNLTEVVISNIPQNYADLVLTYSGTSSANQGLRLTYNSETAGTNYSRVVIWGSGSGTGNVYSPSGNTDSQVILEPGVTQSTSIAHFLDYSAIDKHKVIISRGGPSSSLVAAQAARWASTSAISRISIATYGGAVINSGSVISLYGVVA